MVPPIHVQRTVHLYHDREHSLILLPVMAWHYGHPPMPDHQVKVLNSGQPVRRMMSVECEKSYFFKYHSYFKNAESLP